MPTDLSAATPTISKTALTPSAPVRVSFPTGLLKNIIDFVGALVAMILFAPIFLVITVVLKLTQEGPIFFSHNRIGKDGKEFRCLKFRTMVPEAAEMLDEILMSDPIAREEWNANYKLDNDPRVTRFGAFLRKSSLDELPQIFNVLKNDMSLVGPRPITKSEGELYGRHYSVYKSVRPGLTGLWQISGRSDTSYEERVLLDVNYVRNLAAWRDIYILLMTVFVVLVRKGAQ